jgi:hypothetical protein
MSCGLLYWRYRLLSAIIHTGENLLFYNNRNSTRAYKVGTGSRVSGQARTNEEEEE